MPETKEVTKRRKKQNTKLNTRRQTEAADRAAQVVDLYLHEDLTIKEAGKKVGVGPTTASKYITAARQRWYEKASLQTEEHLAEELQKLRDRETEVLGWLEHFKPPINEPDEEGYRDYLANSAEARKWVEVWIKLSTRKASLLGLDKAKKLDVKTDQPINIQLNMVDCSIDTRGISDQIIEGEYTEVDEEEEDF